MDLKKDILWRVTIVYFAVALFAIIIVTRVIIIQFVEKDKWKSKAENVKVQDIIIFPDRGDICAEDGRPLCSTVPYYDIRMDFTVINDKDFNSNLDSLCNLLSSTFKDKSANDYKTAMINARKRNERYFLVKRKISHIQYKEISKFPIFKLGRYRSGVIFETRDQRVLPFDLLAERTIGYIYETASDSIIADSVWGKKIRGVGLEMAYDKELRGIKGVKSMRKLSGDVWMPVEYGNEVEPENGKDLITTINIDYQDVAETALLNQLNKSKAEWGTAVLMEVKTGEIKAIANLERNKKGNYTEEYNHAVGTSIEPGSTFKLFSMMAALEDNFVSPTDSINIYWGEKSYYDRKMRDSKVGIYKTLSVQQVFEKSSNVGVAEIITRNYSDKKSLFLERLKGFGIHSPLFLEIPGEGMPLVKEIKKWSGISLPWMSNGYEVLMTPLQLLTYYNAIANNGKVLKPKFVKALRKDGEIVQEFPTEVINQAICSKKTLRILQNMLIGVVEHGTARNIATENYKIAGKTGTVQVAYSSGSAKGHRSSFVGYFPADNPQYSCIIVIHRPSEGGYYGSEIAGPVFREIADKVYSTSLEIQQEKLIAQQEIKELPYTKSGNWDHLKYLLNKLNINISNEKVNSSWVSTYKREEFIEIKPKVFEDNLVPDVKGMGLRDAMFLLNNAGLEVEIEGIKRGRVTKQNINPGKRIIPGQEIIIVLG
ncbi:MAG: transpeptidase family protein [Bacteroidales bacterium]|nr:transpeptidase family protein [Bacteroidales bacterium]